MKYALLLSNVGSVSVFGPKNKVMGHVKIEALSGLRFGEDRWVKVGEVDDDGLILEGLLAECRRREWQVSLIGDVLMVNRRKEELFTIFRLLNALSKFSTENAESIEELTQARVTGEFLPPDHSLEHLVAMLENFRGLRRLLVKLEFLPGDMLRKRIGRRRGIFGLVKWAPVARMKVDAGALRVSYPDVFHEVAEESNYRSLLLLRRSKRAHGYGKAA